MIPCPYCGRYFKNKRSVRPHLSNCPNYEPKREPHTAFAHSCGAVYVSGRGQPKRICPACGVDIKDEPDGWERLGYTDHRVGPVPDGEHVELLD